jgi:hypothetical protein
VARAGDVVTRIIRGRHLAFPFPAEATGAFAGQVTSGEASRQSDSHGADSSILA